MPLPSTGAETVPAQTQNLPAATQDPSEVVDPGEPGQVDPAQKPAETDAERTIRKLQKSVSRLTGKRYQEAARAETAIQETQRLREQLQRLTAPQPGTPQQALDDDGQPLLSRKEAERIARDGAERLAEGREIERRIDAVKTAGKKIDGFDGLVDAVDAESPLVDGRGNATPFLRQVLECDKPADVLAYLGANTDELDEFEDLTPSQVQRRLVRIEDKIAAAAKVAKSAAPKPLTPETGGKGASGGKLADLSDDEFYKRRNAQTRSKK